MKCFWRNVKESSLDRKLVNFATVGMLEQYFADEYGRDDCDRYSGTY